MTNDDRWSEVLRETWETLARTSYRDYFIASHRGWDDPETWLAQARFDADIVLHEIPAQKLAAMDILELGCGVGRLAQVIAPLARSYTGFDIAPSMVAEAERRQAGLRGARFLLGDGRRVPEPARDRRYGLAFALAVFYHCPRAVVAELVADICSLLTPGGEFRFQLRADASDPTGIAPLSEAPLTVAPPRARSEPLSENEMSTLGQIDGLVGERYYQGDAFRYDEVVPFLRAAFPRGEARLLRFDPHNIYVDLRIS
ncbi:MAG: methyltransferase domain-containing protein [Planctomycetota bacterium]